MKFSILFVIIILAFFLRVYHLGTVPISPDWDEASLGYNAYSILHTARDEYGKFLPVIFRSFDDYKPGLYVYLTVPSVALFGLTVFAVRLPAALIGVLAVLGVYFLVKEVFPKTKAWYFPELCAFMLAISPWHIQFSHMAFEAGVGAASNIFMALFFLKGLKQKKYLFLAVFFLAFGMNVYQSERVFAPLLFVVLSLLYRGKIIHMQKRFIAALIIFLFILNIPFISFVLTNKNAFARAKGVLVFSEPAAIQLSSQRINVDKQAHDLLGIILDNRRIEFTKTVFANYVSHFDFNWLFITGDISRHHAPGMGLLYLWELPFIFIGMYALLFGEYERKVKLLFFLWFFLVPIPAAITSGVPHAVRTINFLPVYQLFSALGIVTVLAAIRCHISTAKYPIYILGGFYILFIIFTISYYFNQYYVQQRYFNAVDWQYGYEKMVAFVKAHEKQYRVIIVSSQPYMDQSYIFFLFYLRYDPHLYQIQSENASGGFREDHMFGNYQFRPIFWNKEEKAKDILYVGRPDDFPPNAQRLFEVDFPDTKPAMLAIKEK